MTKKEMKPVAMAVGAALAISLAGVSVAKAETSPFSMSSLSSGYMVALGEGACGGDKGEEGKCGGDKEGKEKGVEGSCGGDKEAKEKGVAGSGADKEGEEKGEEGKCGEGKCGGAI